MVPVALLISLMLVLSGCIPVPTPGHSYGATVDKEAFDALQPGIATRADVLLTLGQPTRSLEDDRYFIYTWTVVYGYAVIVLGAGYSGYVHPVPVTAPNYLCFEFGSNSELVRRENLRGSLYEKPYMAISACTQKPEKKDGPP